MGGKNTKQKKKEEKEAKDDKKDETPNAADAKTPNAESDKQPDTANEEAKPDDKTGDSGGKEGEAEKPEAADGDAVKSSEPEVPAKVSTEFKWEDGGETVEVSGSFNSWDKIKLEKKDEVFTVAVDLEPGEYLYKYVVDGEWKINKNQATKAGEDGIENNFIEVKAA